jgi:hypothetical protein
MFQTQRKEKGMRKAIKISMMLAVFFVATMGFVGHSAAFDADYSVFIFIPGHPIWSDMLSLTYDGALIFDSSYGSGTYMDLGGPFVGTFITTDLFASPAVFTMVGVVANPIVFATGVALMGGRMNVFTLTGRLLWNYDYEEEE